MRTTGASGEHQPERDQHPGYGRDDLLQRRSAPELGLQELSSDGQSLGELLLFGVLPFLRT